MHLQRLEDYNRHRLVNAFGKVRQGNSRKKMLNNTFEAGMCSAPQERRSPVGGSPTQIVVGKSGS